MSSDIAERYYQGLAAEAAQRQAEAQQQQREQAAAKLQAVTNNLNLSIGESAMSTNYDEMVKKHAKEIAAEIAREEAKSEHERKLETATAAENTLAEEYAYLAKSPSKNLARMSQIEQLLKQQKEEIQTATSALQYEAHQRAQQGEHQGAEEQPISPARARENAILAAQATLGTRRRYGGR
jgi:hypothetical protein